MSSSAMAKLAVQMRSYTTDLAAYSESSYSSFSRLRQPQNVTIDLFLSDD